MSEKKQKKDHPLFDIQQVASFTECTGILPAQIQTDDEGEAISALQNTFPPHPLDDVEDEEK